MSWTESIVSFLQPPHLPNPFSTSANGQGFSAASYAFDALFSAAVLSAKASRAIRQVEYRRETTARQNEAICIELGSSA